MGLKIQKEVNRLPGLDPNGGTILAGQPIIYWTATSITVATAGLSSSSYTVVGVAADTTSSYGVANLGGAGQNLGSVQFLDDYAKGGLISAFVDGGTFEVFDDGRGAVFESDVVGANVGQALYVSSAGRWTAAQGSNGTVGYIKVASVVKAPTATTDTLILQFLPA